MRIFFLKEKKYLHGAVWEQAAIKVHILAQEREHHGEVAQNNAGGTLAGSCKPQKTSARTKFQNALA